MFEDKFNSIGVAGYADISDFNATTSVIPINAKSYERYYRIDPLCLRTCEPLHFSPFVGFVA